MQKRAIVYIDNTLWHFCDALYEELTKINENFPVPGKWTDWDMWEAHCSADEFMTAVNSIHFGQDSDRYVITGSLIEITSVELVNGGAAVRIPVHLVVQRTQGRWLITDYAEER